MGQWPDVLSPPDTNHMESALAEFWHGHRTLADLLARGEYILAEEHVTAQRLLVIEMMLAANGIAWPNGTLHLNGYLGESQRVALERTLVASGSPRDGVIARMVALTTIYRWYAPQLVERMRIAYPDTTEAEVWRILVVNVPEWPQTIESP